FERLKVQLGLRLVWVLGALLEERGHDTHTCTAENQVTSSLSRCSLCPLLLVKTDRCAEPGLVVEDTQQFRRFRQILPDPEDHDALDQGNQAVHVGVCCSSARTPQGAEDMEMGIEVSRVPCEGVVVYPMIVNQPQGVDRWLEVDSVRQVLAETVTQVSRVTILPIGLPDRVRPINGEGGMPDEEQRNTGRRRVPGPISNRTDHPASSKDKIVLGPIRPRSNQLF
ncbi:unnamed protein product, partial [Mycena citricolor]